jgi:endonuclease G
MSGVSKIVLLVVAGLSGVLVLIMGNNPFGGGGESPNDEEPTYIVAEDDDDNQDDDNQDVVIREVDDNLPLATLNYYPTQELGDQLVRYSYYTISYSNEHRNAEWVAYELLGARLDLSNRRERQNFKSDPNVRGEASSSDYRNSGYDRGHLVPAHDMDFNKDAMSESFYMTNVSPQVPDFNRGIWKSLEGNVRKWAKKEKRLYVITGPLLKKTIEEADRISPNGPTIPRGFFKIVVDYEGGEKKGIAFMFKNKNIDQPLERFVTTIDLVEKYTNLDFFPDLTAAEEASIESVSDISLWTKN